MVELIQATHVIVPNQSAPPDIEVVDLRDLRGTLRPLPTLMVFLGQAMARAH